MSLPHDPQDHEQFESLCTGVEDYETLPVINTRPDVTWLFGEEAQSDSLNDEILAGLVSP